MTGADFGSSTARVATDRPGRYAKQLVSHLGGERGGHWSSEEERGDITFVGEGAHAENPRRAFDGTVRVNLVAADSVLLIHLEGPAELIPRFEGVVGSHLVRFAAKDGLSVSWRRGNGDVGTEQQPGEI